jgi:tRNA 2-thiouridine synthesizing protein A
MADTLLDLRGLKCPLPALKIRKALSRLGPGDTLTAECTDPLSAIDVPNLIRETGDSILETRQADGLLAFRIRKEAPPRVT